MLITEVISAFLDDCDLLDGYRRSINLRDNPNTQSGIQSDLFIATAIIYEDVNFDAAWNSESEPILAALDSQSLLFYPSIPDAPIYGESPDGTTYQAPVLSASQIDQTTGWHVYNDESDHTETVPYLRILKHLTPVNSNMLTLSPVHLDVSEGFMPGCYLNPQTPQQMPCTGILPLLVR